MNVNVFEPLSDVLPSVGHTHRLNIFHMNSIINEIRLAIFPKLTFHKICERREKNSCRDVSNHQYLKYKILQPP